MYSISGGGSGGLPADVTYHKYRVYGPRDHQLDSWDSWNFACFMNGGGKLVQFESRREQECLIKYINDEIDSTTMNKYAIGLYGASDHGIFEWYRKEQGTPEAGTTDDPTPSFTNWKTGVTPSGNNAHCFHLGSPQRRAQQTIQLRLLRAGSSVVP